MTKVTTLILALYWFLTLVIEMNVLPTPAYEVKIHTLCFSLQFVLKLFIMSPSFECKDFKSIKRVVYLIHTAQPVDVPCRNTLGLPLGD